MNENDGKTPCRHRYIAGYSFRLPQTFFRSLPCDLCGRKIRLKLPWRIFYRLINILGFIFAFNVSESVPVRFLGSTAVVSFLVFLLLLWILQLIDSLIFQYGKWEEADKK